LLEEQFERALVLHRQGRLFEAEHLAEAILRHKPKHFDALHLLGLIALQSRRTERGVDLLKKAVRIDSTVAAAFNNLGIGLVTLKHLGAALAAFDKAIDIDAENAEAHGNRGNVLRDLNRPIEARASYHKANELRASQKSKSAFQMAAALYHRGRLIEAENACNEAIQSTPEHFDALHLLGVIALQTQRVERSIELLNTAIQIRPDAASAYNNRGPALAAAMRAEEALASFDKAIALQQDYADAYCNRGVLLQDLARYQDALESYDMAIAINPRLAKAHHNKANVLAHLTRLQEAVASYDDAISAAPDTSEAYTNRGTALRSLGHFDRALESYDQALSLKPDNLDACLNRGNILLELKRYDEALAAYDRVLGFKSDLAAAWWGRGYIFEQFNRDDDAFNCYNRALALKPDYSEAWLGRGRIRCRLGRRDEGISDYEQALKLGGDAELIRYELAKVGAATIPPTTPVSLVVSLFDRYADHFDEDLLNRLKYRAPVDMADLIESIRPSRDLDILDLGCGTGLVGVHVKKFAKTLCGVDVSSGMLRKAEQRGIYDNLICGEIIGYLSDNSRQYDVAIAADVFVYFGDLTAVFELFGRSLRDDGIFCFSVESGETGDFTLQTNGRYAHSRDYIEALAENCGFTIEAINSCVIRRERDCDVPGFIAAFRRARDQELR